MDLAGSLCMLCLESVSCIIVVIYPIVQTNTHVLGFHNIPRTIGEMAYKHEFMMLLTNNATLQPSLISYSLYLTVVPMLEQQVLLEQCWQK